MSSGPRLLRALPSGMPPPGRLVSIAERPDLRPAMTDVNVSAWPEFMLHDPVANEHWHRLWEDYPSFQQVLLDDGGDVVACFNSAPLVWDGTVAGLPEGWDDQFLRTVDDLDTGRRPNTLGALQVTVRADRRGDRLSGHMLAAMRESASAAGYDTVIACVRPTLKHRYPLVPVEVYAAWLREDGLPFDPWLRVHARAGGEVVRSSPASMTIGGSVADWRDWTALEFPVTGPYIVDGALVPVDIDIERDRGVYRDPNVWMIHRL